jgi:hypothetical protein
MVTALTVEQVQLHSDNLASTANFRVFPLLVETALYGVFSPGLICRYIDSLPRTAIFTILIVASTYLLM